MTEIGENARDLTAKGCRLGLDILDGSPGTAHRHRYGRLRGPPCRRRPTPPTAVGGNIYPMAATCTQRRVYKGCDGDRPPCAGRGPARTATNGPCVIRASHWGVVVVVPYRVLRDPTRTNGRSAQNCRPQSAFAGLCNIVYRRGSGCVFHCAPQLLTL